MNSGVISNHGRIVSEATQANAYGIAVSSGAQSLHNSGSIYAIAHGNTTGVEFWDPDVSVFNSGIIAAYSPAAGPAGVGAAHGLTMFNGGFLENFAGGQILAEGLWATALIFSRGDPHRSWPAADSECRADRGKFA